VHHYTSLLQWSVPCTNGLVCRWVLCVLCTKCTLHSNHNSSTQNHFSPGATIFSLHTLASPSSRNVNYDEKQLTEKKIFELFLLSVQVRKYVSYSFPIIDFCNPRVHCETPCIMDIKKN
jgi:hypothetical protein